MPFKVDLVSFADGAYTNRKSGFLKEATEMKLFRSIDIFDRHSLEPEYFKKHAQFMLSRKRGFGYWIWKSQVVRQKLATMNENDVLVYLDVGFETPCTWNKTPCQFVTAEKFFSARFVFVFR